MTTTKLKDLKCITCGTVGPRVSRRGFIELELCERCFFKRACAPVPKSARAKMAVLVADDVLIQEAMGHYVAAFGTYFRAYLQPARRKTCVVCAIGACWVSHLRLRDRRDAGWTPSHGVGDLTMENDIDDSINGWARLMEAAFEGDVMRWDDEVWRRQRRASPPSLYYVLSRWQTRMPLAYLRLRAIMANVINRGGDFDIDDIRTEDEYREETGS